MKTNAKRLSYTIGILVVLLTTLPNTGHAFDGWSTRDIAMQSVYTILHVMDWGQTLDINKRRFTYTYEGNKVTVTERSEMNPILGKHPSIGKINTYFALTLIGHTAITHVLPKSWRPYWQCITIGIEGDAVIHNFSVGGKINF